MGAEALYFEREPRVGKLWNLLSTVERDAFVLKKEFREFPKFWNTITNWPSDLIGTLCDLERITLSGEPEFVPLQLGFGRVLETPYAGMIRDTLRELRAVDDAFWAGSDPLQRLRLAHDLELAISGLTNAVHQHVVRGIDLSPIQAEIGRLRDDLEDLRKRVALGDAELEALPRWGDIGTLEFLGWKSPKVRTVRWRGTPMVHESIAFGLITNRLIVAVDTPQPPDDDLIRRMVVDGYRPPYRWSLVLLDRLVVTSRSGRKIATAIPAVSRWIDYKPGRGAIGDLPAYGTRLLRRRSTVDRPVVSAPPADELAGTFVDLPNIHGIERDPVMSPVEFSCIQCHMGRPGFPDVPSVRALRGDKSNVLVSGFDP